MDFIMAALPWIIIGICIAIIAVTSKKNENEKVQSYLTEGMCLGMCAGSVISSLGLINFGLGISLGILIGEVIGVNIKKK